MNDSRGFPIGVPKFEKGVVSSPKARSTEIMIDGEGLHPALSGGLGISGHIKKPQSVLTECLSDTTGGAYGPPRHFKGAEIQPTTRCQRLKYVHRFHLPAPLYLTSAVLRHRN